MLLFDSCFCCCVLLGKYSTNDPNVAARYTSGPRLIDPIQPINRVEVPKDTPIYYTDTPLDQTEANVMLDTIQRDTDNHYAFGGPSGPGDSAKEFVYRAKDNEWNDATYHTSQSVHEANRNGEVTAYHMPELEKSEIVPDYSVSIDNGLRFQQENFSYTQENAQRSNFIENSVEKSEKKKKADSKSKLKGYVGEKLAEQGIALKLNDGNENIEDDEQFLRAIELSLAKQNQSNDSSDDRTHLGEAGRSDNDARRISEEKKEGEDDGKEKTKCTDHLPNVMCMKCLNGSSGSKIKRIGNSNSRIHGFNN